MCINHKRWGADQRQRWQQKPRSSESHRPPAKVLCELPAMDSSMAPPPVRPPSCPAPPCCRAAASTFCCRSPPHDNCGRERSEDRSDQWIDSGQEGWHAGRTNVHAMAQGSRGEHAPAAALPRRRASARATTLVWPVVLNAPCACALCSGCSLGFLGFPGTACRFPTQRPEHKGVGTRHQTNVCPPNSANRMHRIAACTPGHSPSPTRLARSNHGSQRSAAGCASGSAQERRTPDRRRTCDTGGRRESALQTTGSQGAAARRNQLSPTDPSILRLTQALNGHGKLTASGLQGHSQA